MKLRGLLSLVLIIIVCLSLMACGKPVWADHYVELINSGDERSYENYGMMESELNRIREESGGVYVYALSPIENGEISLDIEDPVLQSFALTVDGSEEPDDWGIDYGREYAFVDAWYGRASAASFAWTNGMTGDNDDMCWSAFAPIYDSESNVVCLLGIDYPCADIIKDYPEWNRDNPNWNGFTAGISGEIPKEIQELRSRVTGLAEKYASQLSGVK